MSKRLRRFNPCILPKNHFSVIVVEYQAIKAGSRISRDYKTVKSKKLARDQERIALSYL